MTKIVVVGPNLRDQSKGNFRAHADGCRDLTKDLRLTQEPPWSFDADSRVGVAAEIYPPEEFGWSSDASGEWEAFVNDIWFAPCLKQLPEGSLEGGAAS